MRLNRHLRRPLVLVPVVLLVVSGLVVGVVTGAIASVGRSGLYASGLLSDGGASTIPPGTFDHPATPKPSAPAPEPQGAPPAVLAPAKAGPPPDARRVSARVSAVARKGMKGSFSGSVLDVGSGKTLYAKNATKGYIPASTLKLVTTSAALSILGPQHRFTTKVVRAGGGQITLVGGGDPYLSAAATETDPDRASLADLAEATARQLKKDRITHVQLGYDVTLFSGPEWHPDWPAAYRDQVTPIAPLWVNEGRVRGAVGARVANPAKAAANAFASALKARGVRVSQVKKTAAPRSAKPVASVQSLPLDRIVEHLLMVSDNDAAEVVARQAAIGAGKPGSFAAAREVVQARLIKLGVWDKAARIRDGSGLSRSNRVPADLMTRLLRLDSQPGHPELRAVLTGLPVAGVEGSLRLRYFEKSATAARGLVRAKTGTLTKVSALAGYVRTGDGSLLVFAFLVNDATDYFATRNWLDRVTGAVGTCGCR